MPQVTFTNNLKRHVNCPPQTVRGATVREALQATFASVPELESYILDDQLRLRRHVMIFVDGHPVADRNKLSDPVSESSEIYVMQALSGG